MDENQLFMDKETLNLMYREELHHKRNMIETGKQGSENVSSMDLMEDMSPDKLLSIQKARREGI